LPRLYSLSKNHPIRIIEGNGFAYLTMVLKKCEVGDELKLAARVIVRLSSFIHGFEKKIKKAETIPVLVGIIETTDDKKLKYHCTRALSGIVANGDHKIYKQIVKSGAMNLLIKQFKTSTESDILKDIVKVLRNLSKSKQSAITMVDDGIVPFIVEKIKDVDIEHKIKANALSLMYNLAYVEENVPKILEEKELINSLIENFMSESHKVKKFSRRVLSILAHNDPALPKIFVDLHSKKNDVQELARFSLRHTPILYIKSKPAENRTFDETVDSITETKSEEEEKKERA